MQSSPRSYDLLLLRARHHELSLLGTLQSHLLLLNGVAELSSEREVGDGHIIQQDVVLLRTLRKKLRNTLRDLLSLREQLLSVVLSHDSLHDFVAQRRQNTLSVISAHFSVDLGKMVHIRMRQHSKGNTHRLQILRTRLRRDLTGGSTNIINEGVLEIIRKAD